MAVRVKEGISFDVPGGAQVNLRRGQLFPDDHPYVKGREHLFERADDAAARSVGVPVSGAAAAVETATAAPGERRSAVTPRKGSGSSRFADEGADSRA